MPTNRRVAVGDEMRLVAEAERLKRLGEQDFEKAYGPKTVGSFDVTADTAAMQGVGMMPLEQKSPIHVQPAEVPAQVSPPPSQREDPPIPQQGPDALTCPHCGNLLPDFEKKQDELSEDPEKRLIQVAERLRKLNPQAPVEAQIREWKRIHGDVFVIQLSDKIFLFRYLKRQEFIQFNAQPGIEKWAEYTVEEQLFNKCVLWPATDHLAQAVFPAGLITSVVQQIRLNSMFLDPGFVAQFTLKI